MISANELYAQYIIENPNITNSTGDLKLKFRSCKKDRFLEIAKEAGSVVLPIKEGKKECRKVLVRQLRSKMGVIEYFLLKAIIGWIIDKILSYYFL
jgi:hypothetical protein